MGHFSYSVACMIILALVEAGCGSRQRTAEPYAVLDSAAIAVLKGMPGGGVSPSDGRLLYDLVVNQGYRRALDIGTAQGYSSIWLAEAMQRTGGTVTTIEIDRQIALDAQVNFRRAGVARLIDPRTGDALAVIPSLRGDFDFVFMDVGASINRQLLDLLHDRIKPGGAITAHNANWFWLQQFDFLMKIRNDPGAVDAHHQEDLRSVSRSECQVLPEVHASSRGVAPGTRATPASGGRASTRRALSTRSRSGCRATEVLQFRGRGLAIRSRI